MTLLNAKCSSKALTKAITPVCSTTFIKDKNEPDVMYKVTHSKCYHYYVSMFSLSRNLITNEHKKTLLLTQRMKKADVIDLIR